MFGIDWSEVDLGGKLSSALDFKLNDLLGLNEQPVYGGLGTNPYPETTRPADNEPAITGYKFGNNTTTYAAGFGLLLVGIIAYKAIK